MTDFERRIKTRMIEDEYAERFHQLDMEEAIAHINGDKNKLCEISEKKMQMELNMEFEKNMLNYKRSRKLFKAHISALFLFLCFFFSSKLWKKNFTKFTKSY